MAKTNSAKLTLELQPEKKTKAWNIKIVDQGYYWVPFSCIKGYNPVTLEITIETWILKQKSIKFKV